MRYTFFSLGLIATAMMASSVIASPFVGFGGSGKAFLPGGYVPSTNSHASKGSSGSGGASDMVDLGGDASGGSVDESHFEVAESNSEGEVPAEGREVPDEGEEVPAEGGAHVD